MFMHTHMESDGAADDVKFIQGNLQAAQNIHYALSTFCKLEKQLNWNSSFDIQDKKNREESYRGEANSSTVR